MKAKAGTVRTSVDLPVDLHRRLKELAARKGCSARSLIVESVENTVAGDSLVPARARLDLRSNALVKGVGRPVNATPEMIDELLTS